MPAQPSASTRPSAEPLLTIFEKLPVLTVAPIEHVQFSITMPRELAHTSAEVTSVPDGTTFVSRCACGARIEKMVDASDFAFASATDDEIFDFVCALGDSAPHAQIERWQRDHRGCTVGSRAPVLPQQVTYFIEAIWESSIEAIERGDNAYNVLYVIMSDHQICAFPLDEFRRVVRLEPHAGPLAAEHTTHAAVRAFGRQTNSEPIAAVTVAEAWARSIDGATRTTTEGPRGEALVLWATTPTGGISRIAPIARSGEDGAGIIGDAVTVPLSVPCALLDGVLAKAVQVPVAGRAR